MTAEVDGPLVQLQEVRFMNGKEYFRKGQQALMIGDLDESSKMFGMALKRDYEPVKTLLSRGTVYLVSNDLVRALRDFSWVLEIDGNNERAFYYRGIIHLRRLEYIQAAADLDEALARNPQRGPAYFARGVAWTMLGREELAAADFQQAVNLAPAEAQIFRRLFGNDPDMLGRWESFPAILSVDEIKKIRRWM